MSDNLTTLQELKIKAQTLVNDRAWSNFHSPKNLSMCLAAEAAELMELFLWVDSKESEQELEKKRQEVEHELADVLLSVLCFADQNNIDLSNAFDRKMKLIEEKYPVEKAKGNFKKYTEL